ncbi:MAG TPA: NADH-quinone oxidoreductase subunit NuoH [Gemmatimonadaceae bacterium]|nr:NADH-quinone oxidoreductase subunit NuoH [Gemmatimonadaceae bacterium]
MHALLQVVDRQAPITGYTTYIIFSIIKLIVVFTVYMVSAALLTLAERKISAWIQGRHGPNRVGGRGGWLQPAADGVKNFMKEETEPGNASHPLFSIAPALSFVPAMLVWCVIPFGSPLPTPWGRVDLVVADLPVGFLFILAIASLGVYGVVLAGWASNNKYSFLGGLRSSAQMVSYEVALGMSTIPIILLAGNVTMSQIIRQQAHSMWNVLNLTTAFVVFFVAALAENNRVPFDLPEAESELIAGYHTEYSAMKFSLFFIAEYANMVTAGALMATLFLGGWDIPFTGWDNAAPYTVLKTVLTLGCFLTKTGFFVFTFIWIRWTLPRFRYDQLMSLGWRVMLPVALGYIALLATTLLVLQAVGINPGPAHSFILLMENICVLLVLFVMVDDGRVISPAYGRAQQARITRLRARSARLAVTEGAGK